MPYELGIDLGTTYSAAAVHRDGRISVVTLGNRAPSVPSVVLLRSDGDLLTGEAASRRAAAEPDRVAREFKRRLGDPTPLILGSTPYSAESLMARLLKWIVEAVTEREGEAPRAVGLTHPANWGDYKRDLLVQAVRIAGLDKATLLSEPEAAAIHYASLERVEPGTLVAVYDLGGGTFDAAVLRKRGDDSFEMLGQPEGIERLGGIDFDEAIFRYVLRAVGDPIQALDADDPAVVSAFVRLREECIEAKEALSSDTEATIPVLLPNVQSEVRLTRREFESMVRPTLSDTIDALRRALHSAGVDPSELDKVLLVGGSSRIPLVSQMVSAALDRPVAVDTDPKLAVASGAAMAATRALLGGAAPKATPAPSVLSAETAAPARPTLAATSSSVATAVPLGRGERRKGVRLLAGAAIVSILALGTVFFLAKDDGDGVSATPEEEGGLISLAGDVLGIGDDDGGAAMQLSADTTAAAAAASKETTTLPPETTMMRPQTSTTSRFVVPSHYEGYVQITGISVSSGTYAIAFNTGDKGMDINNHHAHFFWNTTPRVQAGTNGTPEPGEWLAYADASPAINSMFRVENRPEGATAICALVGNGFHEIADVTGDGQKDSDSGNCWALPGL